MLDNLLMIFIFFIVPSVLVLNFLIIKNRGKISIFFITLISLGVGPLINGLLFFYLMWFFPEKSDLFYILSLLLFWVIPVVYLIISIRSFCEFLYLFIEKIVNKKNIIYDRKFLVGYLIIVFAISIFITQALFYPAADNDRSLYLNQSEAIYGSKNFDWRTENKNVIIRGNDEYKYNPAIRPGIPFSMIVTYAYNEDYDSRDFFIRFQSVYYYVLLLLLFILVVYRFSLKIDIDPGKSLFSSLILFVFSSGLSRMVIFGSKETAIYFFALASLYLLIETNLLKKRDLYTEFILGVVLGLNSFINLHGTFVAGIIIILVFLFSKIKIVKRISQVFSLVLMMFIFGGMEIFSLVKLIFFNRVMVSSVGDNTMSISKLSNDIATVATRNKENLTNIYQTNNITDTYLKGRLQILTNIGYFGYHFWIFLIIIFFKWKDILKTHFGKIVSVFILIYFVLVLDPFNLNSNRYADILWGSVKYAMLVLLLSIIFSGTFIHLFMKNIVDFIVRRRRYLIVSVSIFLMSAYFFYKQIREIGLSMLFSVIKIYKDTSFYEQKFDIYFKFLLLILVVFILALILYRLIDSKNFNFIIFSMIWLVIITPFFIIDMGKVPILKTFSYVKYKKEEKLKNMVMNGDVFDVYFYAKKILPKDSVLMTGFNEIFPYDDHFSLTKRKTKDTSYSISKKCDVDSKILYEKNGIFLCSK
ncbi:MAG: hypothetical protein UR69_C0001G0132 [Candidatus Moranbacteria bacterium GW2011_GWE2_35_2-]|nr:MAG: hypothetical protein UR69_C0001G0132 [Candidatus Moranbacteria bacterium GW2011_GWE2_35_2-]KKQ22870.1 MAG: hypothetical protein US37_C0001G0142 [Candidatus Moranbacteria bacterium GW2011_GWF2_37_11]KKQ29228.1 MAG: hypothetical protein US44_C0002G0010 [Candidatus Moranbacteria bacterium GW2011_GWD1_37_17]KKQ30899.1 MAG: hypothetical protein US47_C0001G0132 [Candidatus Moranbacteria bacterium GW2011_GWE1_37_24]KKQ46969.1 MAG: hypothetical protein US66_C0023G0014 [Candidatus Moranbacteria 